MITLSNRVHLFARPSVKEKLTEFLRRHLGLPTGAESRRPRFGNTGARIYVCERHLHKRGVYGGCARQDKQMLRGAWLELISKNECAGIESKGARRGLAARGIPRQPILLLPSAWRASHAHSFTPRALNAARQHDDTRTSCAAGCKPVCGVHRPFHRRAMREQPLNENDRVRDRRNAGMSIESNLQLVRDWVERVWNEASLQSTAPVSSIILPERGPGHHPRRRKTMACADARHVSRPALHD